MTRIQRIIIFGLLWIAAGVGMSLTGGTGTAVLALDGGQIVFTEPTDWPLKADCGTLSDGYHDPQEGTNAMISDVQSIYRLCNSRPQRLLSFGGIKQNRVLGRTVAAPRNTNFKTANAAWRWSHLAAPFQASASRHYFIIALRRIIR